MTTQRTYTQEELDAAVRAEQDRILAIERLSEPGAEGVIRACVADRSVTPEQAAMRILEHQRSTRSAALRAMQDDEAALETPAAGAHAGIEGRDPARTAAGAIAAARKAGVLRR